MTYVIGVPLGLFGFYLAVRLASYAICQSIKQVFHKQKERTHGKETQEG